MAYANYYVRIDNGEKRRFRTDRINIDYVLRAGKFDLKGRTNFQMNYISGEDDWVRVNKRIRNVVFECRTYKSALKTLTYWGINNQAIKREAKKSK